MASKLEHYTDDVIRTAPKGKDRNDFLTWAALGLCEAGEVQNTVKKFVHQGGAYDRGSLVEELGDLFYYMVALMVAEGITLAEVIDTNVDKRKDFVPGIGRMAPLSGE